MAAFHISDHSADLSRVAKPQQAGVLRALIASAKLRQAHHHATIEDGLGNAATRARIQIGEARITALQNQLSSLS